MADKVLPDAQVQNPAPVGAIAGGQSRLVLRQALADRIVDTLLQVLPSNYVSQVRGPAYTLWLQAMAERMADIQIEAQAVFEDSAFDATRSEFLWQVLGRQVFPDVSEDGRGMPVIEGDVPMRTLLSKLVLLLLKGSKVSTLQSGLALLTEADIELTERFLSMRNLGAASGWGPDDQFTIDVDVTKGSGTAFPIEPFILQENVEIVAKALKPAHALVAWRHLFKEGLDAIKADSSSWTMKQWRRDDLRKNWLGARRVVGTGGVTLTDRRLFQDVARDFSQIQSGADLTILSGPNSIGASSTDDGSVGRFRVVEVLTFPIDPEGDISRPYLTTPTGLSGFAYVISGCFVDRSRDWSLAKEGEVLTLTAGPNAGQYRLATIQGNDGGPIGLVAPTGQNTGPRTVVRPAPSILRLDRAMASAATGQGYEVVVDRKGVQEPRIVTAEDVSDQFWV